MKVIYISGSIIPSRTANSVHVMKMAQAFAENDIDIELYARTNKSTIDIKNDFENYGVRETFKLHKIKVPGIRYFNNLYYSLTVLKKISGEKERKSQRIIYGRDLLSLVILSFIYKNIYYEAHSAPEGFLNRMLLKVLFKSSNFNELVVISNALKKEYENHFNKKLKINVLHDGADVNITHDQKKSSDVIIGYTGSIYSGRGIEIIVEVAKKLKSLSFQIVGGTREQALELYSEKIDIPGNIEFIGYVNPQEVPGYLNKMTIVLAPYQRKVGIGRANADTSKWMSPLKIFEYMAAGKAIICSDIPVLREVLKDHHNCILVDPEDVDQWANAIAYLIKNEELKVRLGNQAKKDLEAVYSWKVRAATIKKIFKKIESLK